MTTANYFTDLELTILVTRIFRAKLRSEQHAHVADCVTLAIDNLYRLQRGELPIPYPH